MAQVTVSVNGYGTFQIHIEKVAQLLSWLASNQAVDVTQSNVVREVKNNTFTGKVLIND